MRKYFIASVLFISILGFSHPMLAQSAQVTGVVSDSSKAAISGAAIEIVNEDTREIIQTRTNHSGLYTAPSVKPGHYTATVSAPGFEKEIVEHLVVEVAAKLSFDYVLHAGAVSQTVTVDGSGVSLNTTDATVSTVIDRQFVSNMPLNGRSFQSLLTLVPGVTVVPSPFGQGESGEIAVNGQRTEANNFLIDGVNANTGQANGYGGSPVWGAGFSGATPAEPRWVPHRAWFRLTLCRSSSYDFNLLRRIWTHTRRTVLLQHTLRHRRVAWHRVRLPA